MTAAEPGDDQPRPDERVGAEAAVAPADRRGRSLLLGTAGWLWLVSMALLVAATVAWPRREIGGRRYEVRGKTDDRRTMIDDGADVGIVHRPSWAGSEPIVQQPWTRWEMAGLGGLLVL